MRICSLLPSATEILYALDLGESVSGVTFECDYPAAARMKPIIVDAVLRHGLTPAEIDREVSAHAAAGESIYRIDRELLESIAPDLVVTQELCDVCAVSTSHLVKALYGLTRQPEVVSLTPHTLEDVFVDIETLGRAADREEKARWLVASLRARVEGIRAKPKGQTPRVACLEWMSPPFNAGHWVPQMVDIAGGIDGLGVLGKESTRIGWEVVRQLDPEVLLAMPCGYDAETAAKGYRGTEFPGWWRDLSAVQSGRAYALNANAYFSRPGPRLVDGIEVLYALLQEDFSARLPEGAWVQL